MTQPLSKAQIRALADIDLPLIAKITRAKASAKACEAQDWLQSARKLEREIVRREVAREKLTACRYVQPKVTSDNSPNHSSDAKSDA